MHAVAPLIDESSGESPLTVEYPGNGVIRFNAAIRVAIKRYNHAVTWATRHFISLISISKKYESNFKEISKLHLLVVIYECTSGQRKHSVIFTETDEGSRTTASVIYLFPGYANCAHGRVRSLPDDDSRTTAERVICFRGTQTVPVAARNDRLTPQQRIVTQIIWDISRCPHGPVVTKFYCPAPHFYLPRDVGTCLSLSPGSTYWL